MKQKKTSCNEIKTIEESTCLGYNVGQVEEIKIAVIA